MYDTYLLLARYLSLLIKLSCWDCYGVLDGYSNISLRQKVISNSIKLVTVPLGDIGDVVPVPRMPRDQSLYIHDASACLKILGPSNGP